MAHNFQFRSDDGLLGGDGVRWLRFFSHQTALGSMAYKFY